MSFGEKIKKASQENRTRTVLALDLGISSREQLLERSRVLLDMVGKHLCAVKINQQLLLPLGLRDGVDSMVKLIHAHSLPVIMDAKLNDVGHTNKFMMQSYVDAGFDAVIASPIVGWEDGLDSVFRLAEAHDKSVILLVYMSNIGAAKFYSLMVSRGSETPRPVFELLAEMALEWKAHGVVVGATGPDIISRVRGLVGRGMAIYSPGVGVQGGDARNATEAGADYLIVGRSIYQAKDPSKAAREFAMYY